VFDYLIIGGGIVGVSTAWQLQQRKPNSSILLLEKESRLASHQTSRNSGVIHAGIYYTPGSLKARFCKEGVDATIRFCRARNIAVEQCGKLIVATDDAEHERMLALYERARDNGLDVELLDATKLRTREPNIIGTGAIFLRTTGITDYSSISPCVMISGCSIAYNFSEYSIKLRIVFKLRFVRFVLSKPV